jgi:hypothetical protein
VLVRFPVVANLLIGQMYTGLAMPFQAAECRKLPVDALQALHDTDPPRRLVFREHSRTVTGPELTPSSRVVGPRQAVGPERGMPLPGASLDCNRRFSRATRASGRTFGFPAKSQRCTAPQHSNMANPDSLVLKKIS